MKTTKNFWRVITLALALVMLFSVVACNNNGEPAASTEASSDGSTTPVKLEDLEIINLDSLDPTGRKYIEVKLGIK